MSFFILQVHTARMFSCPLHLLVHYKILNLPSPVVIMEMNRLESLNGNVTKGSVGSVLSTTCQQLSINPTLYSYTCPDDRNVTFTIRDVTLEEHMMAWQCKISVNSVFQLSNTVKVTVLGTF